MKIINHRPERTHQHFPLLKIMARYNANPATEQPGRQRLFFPSALSSLPLGSSARAAAARSPSGRGAVPTRPSARCWTAHNGTAPRSTGTRLRGPGWAGTGSSRGDPVLSASVGKPPSSALLLGAASQSRLTALAPDPHPRSAALPHRPPRGPLRAVRSLSAHSLTHHGTDGGDFGDRH